MTEGKKKNEKEGKIRISILIFIYTIHFADLKMYTKFENTGPNRSPEICDRNFLWREKKRTNKGTDKQYVAVFFVTQYNSSLSSFVLKFQNPKSSSCCENVGKKCPYLLYKSDRRKKEKLKQEGKMRISISIFINTMYFAYLRVYTKFETLAPIGTEKSVTEISIGEKDNKGTDKQYVFFFVTQYNSSLSSFVPNFRNLIQVVAEKSLTENKVYRQRDKQN